MYETDEQLYSRFLARGDRADLGVLLERHGESLTLFLNGYVHSAEDAEELMLDAFAAAAGRAAFGRGCLSSGGIWRSRGSESARELPSR